jgi:hypothetical protein
MDGLCEWFTDAGHWIDLRTPNSLRDSNVSPKLKTIEGQGVGARSLVRSTIEG